MGKIEAIFALLIGAAVVNVIVNGKNTAGVISAGSTGISGILGTLTRSA